MSGIERRTFGGSVPVPWALSTVGPDLSSLHVHFSGDWFVGNAAVSVRESDDEICIAVEHPDPRSFDMTEVPLSMVLRNEVVELSSLVRGRRLTVPAGAPAWRGALGWELLPDGQPVVRLIGPDHAMLVPRVLGLHADDADRLLQDQQLRPRRQGCDILIVAQDPEPDTPTQPNAVITLTTA